MIYDNKNRGFTRLTVTNKNKINERDFGDGT
jgi:hypothetical protein